MIASHYAEPLARRVTSDAQLLAAPSAAADCVATLSKGEDFALLDSTRGWAWGYAADGRVGYLPATAVGA